MEIVCNVVFCFRMNCRRLAAPLTGGIGILFVGTWYPPFIASLHIGLPHYTGWNIIIFQAHTLLDPISHKTRTKTVREEVILAKEGISLPPRKLYPWNITKKGCQKLSFSFIEKNWKRIFRFFDIFPPSKLCKGIFKYQHGARKQ